MCSLENEDFDWLALDHAYEAAEDIKWRQFLKVECSIHLQGGIWFALMWYVE